MSLYKAGFCRGSLVLLCFMAFALAACTQAAPQANKRTFSSDHVVRWIQQNAISLRTVNPGGTDADLMPFQQVVGNASIVGLGEATHGTHEFYEIKARLAEFLIAKMGYTTFIMENDWGASRLIDASINGGPDTIKSVMRVSLFSLWQTQEYRALLEWMRSYNADPAHTTKIHFWGMDSEHVSQSDFDAVENYLHMVDPLQVTNVQKLYRPIIAASLPNPYKTYVALGASTRQQYQSQAQQIYDLLQAHQQIYTDHSSSRDFALALQNARVFAQFTTSLMYDTPQEPLANIYKLDTFMAENVAWIHDHDAGSNPKIIVWAHDAHIANDTSYGSQDGRNMGGELRARYKDNYMPIGTTLYQGTLRTYDYPKTATQQISAPDPSTYNYDLGQADLPLYMLDLRKIPPGPMSDWAHRPTTTLLMYGQGGEDLSTICLLVQWFDVILHVQQTTPSKPL